jgi:hypothetical protein
MTAEEPGALRNTIVAAGRVIGAGAGAAFAGSSDVVAASASQAVVEVVDAFDRLQRRRRAQRAGYALEQGARIGGLTAEELVDRLSRGPIQGVLADRLLTAARDAASQRKLVAIGAKLYELSELAADAPANQQIVDVTTLSALEEPHVAVLDLLASHPDGLATADIAQARPELGPVVHPLLGVLQAHQLIAGADDRWQPTGYGRYLLQLFVFAGQQLDTEDGAGGVDG